MRQSLIIANWKMNGSKEALDQFLPQLIEYGVQAIESEVVLCPPAIYIQYAAGLSAGALALGGQDISEHSSGAYTGELSGSMLQDMQANWVIVGHSERRGYHDESDAQVVAKANAALNSGLTPVVCVGETLDEREQGITEKVIARQVNALVEALKGTTKLADIGVAYEPVWAIGTGKTASPEQAQVVHQFIRELLGVDGQSIRILYGGSVNPENAAALFQQADIDGGLVGGASLTAKSFIEICRAAA